MTHHNIICTSICIRLIAKNSKKVAKGKMQWNSQSQLSRVGGLEIQSLHEKGRSKKIKSARDYIIATGTKLKMSHIQVNKPVRNSEILSEP